MKRIKTIFFLSLILCILCSPFYHVSAAEMAFSVETVIPSNQIDTSKTYFDLKMKPKAKQKLLVKLTNTTKEPVTIAMSANTAITNDNGIVEYTHTKQKKDSSLKFDFADIVKVAKEITLPANSSKKIPVYITMPKEKFNGVLLGGLHFVKKTDAEKDKPEDNSQVKNNYAYVVGVSLQETNKTVLPHLKLRSVKASQSNLRNVISANIQNDKAAIIPDLSISGKISKSNSDKVLFQTKKDGLKMAPNSNFNYLISAENKPFKPGKYVFEGTAKAGKQTWHFTKTFTIKDKEANAYNDKAVDLEKNYTWLYLVIGISIFVSLIAVIIWLIYKLKKQQKK